MDDSGRPEDIRASNGEREEVCAALGEHFSTGRLDLSEYDNRVQSAAAAKTVGELAELFTDLPDPRPDFVRRLISPARQPPLPAPTPPQAPYGVDPFTGRPYSDRSKVIAGLLQIFFGAFGLGRFYAGRTGIGLTQILMTVLTLGMLAFITVPWGIIDGIIMLTDNSTDGKGRKLR